MDLAYSNVTQTYFTAEQLIDSLEGNTGNYEEADEGELIGRYQIVCEECSHNVFLRRCQDRKDHFVHSWKNKPKSECSKRSARYSKSEKERRISLQSRYRVGYFQKRFEYYIALSTFCSLKTLDIPLLIYSKGRKEFNRPHFSVKGKERTEFLKVFRSLVLSIRLSRDKCIRDLSADLMMALQEFYRDKYAPYETIEEAKQKAKMKFIRDVFGPYEKILKSVDLDDFQWMQRFGIALDIMLHCRHEMARENLNSLIASHLIITTGLNAKYYSNVYPLRCIQSHLDSGILPVNVIEEILYEDIPRSTSLDPGETMNNELRNLLAWSSLYGDKKMKSFLRENLLVLEKIFKEDNTDDIDVAKELKANYASHVTVLPLLLANTNDIFQNVDSSEDWYDEYYEKAGWVYVAWGQSLNDRWARHNKVTDTVKIGKAKDWQNRELTLKNPLDPDDVKIIGAFVVTDRHKAEAFVHEALSEYRLAKEEVFAIKKSKSIEIVSQLVEVFADQSKTKLKTKPKSGGGFM